MPISNPAVAGLQLVVGDTVAYGPAAAPVAWTALDLSAIIGAKASFVVLKVAETGNVGTCQVAFRRNGDTDEFFGGPRTSGYEMGDAIQNSAQLAVCGVMTDGAGIVEWIAQAAHTVTVDVIGYINAA